MTTLQKQNKSIITINFISKNIYVFTEYYIDHNALTKCIYVHLYEDIFVSNVKKQSCILKFVHTCNCINCIYKLQQKFKIKFVYKHI